MGLRIDCTGNGNGQGKRQMWAVEEEEDKAGTRENIDTSTVSLDRAHS